VGIVTTVANVLVPSGTEELVMPVPSCVFTMLEVLFNPNPVWDEEAVGKITPGEAVGIVTTVAKVLVPTAELP